MSEESECKSLDGCECMCVAVVTVENFALPLTVEDPQLHKRYYHHHHYCTVAAQPVFISAAHQTSLNHTPETGPTTTS